MPERPPVVDHDHRLALAEDQLDRLVGRALGGELGQRRLDHLGDRVAEDPRMLGRGHEQAAFADRAHEGAPVLARDDRDLGDAVLAHQLEHATDRVVAVDGEHRPIDAAAADHLADRQRALVAEVAVLAHPRVVEDLGDVGPAAVGDDRRHQRVGVVELAGDRQRRAQRGPGRAAGEQALARDQAPGGQERVAVADRDVAVDERRVEGLRPEVLADPLDAVRVDRAAGVDRALRVGADHLDVGVLLLEVAADAGDRAAGADRDHQVGDPAAGLAPELGAGRAVMRLGVGLVEVLVRLEGARRSPR